MTYKEFTKVAHAGGWSASELRCDVPPSAELLDLLTAMGQNAESFVERYLTIDAKARRIETK